MNPEIIRLAKFVLVGVVVTGIDFVSFWLLLNLFEKLKTTKIAGLRVTTISNIIGFLIANSSSFILNSYFTFSDSATNRGWVPYLLVSLFSLSISSILVQILTSQNTYEYLNVKIFASKLNSKQFALFIKLITVLITMVTNYLGYNYFVY